MYQELQDICTCIYIYERERERERESNHIFYGRRVQNKNSLPYRGDKRKKYKPTQKKKKKLGEIERERVNIF